MNDLAASFQQTQRDTLPGLLGLEWRHAEQRLIQGRLNVEQRHLAPNPANGTEIDRSSPPMAAVLLFE